jgi:hypothetical protein
MPRERLPDGIPQPSLPSACYPWLEAWGLFLVPQSGPKQNQGLAGLIYIAPII